MLNYNIKINNTKLIAYILKYDYINNLIYFYFILKSVVINL